MSLRRKIILLFLGLAVLPLMVLAGVSYWQTRGLLRGTVRDQLMGDVQTLAERLEASRKRAVGETQEWATVLGELDSDSAPKILEAGHNPDHKVLGPPVFLTVQGDDDHPRMLWGARPEATNRCVENRTVGIVEVSAPHPGPGDHRTLTAGFWAPDLLELDPDSRLRNLLIVDPADRSVVFAEGCSGFLDSSIPISILGIDGALTSAEDSGSFDFKADGQAQIGAFAHLSDSRLTVIAVSSPAEVMASVRTLAVAYWIFVLGLGVTTSLAFSLLIGRFTRSLSDLSRAAEEIGMGELDPWLPLPSSGEVGQLTVAFNRMLARIRQMMNQVDQSGRLAVVGQLSAYLAHEIRNPLSSVKMNLQRLRRWTERGELPGFCSEPIEISLREVERLNASVSGVLQLSRSNDTPKEMVSLHELVQEAADLLESRAQQQGVSISLDLDSQADRILARPGQVKGVVLNLMVNALEAQPHGGYLKIHSSLARVEEFGGPVVALHVKDGGPGVPAEVRDRIFEPFFTTKAGGSGIGLAMAVQAVRESGGDLYLEPSFWSRAGSEFVALFPLASLEAGADRSKLEGLDQAPGVGSAAPTRQASGKRWSSTKGQISPHLLTPDAFKAMLALSESDREEDVN